MTFLAIDIGNTRLKWAQYASPQPGARLLNHGAVFLETIDSLADKEWHALPAPGREATDGLPLRPADPGAASRPTGEPAALAAAHADH